MQHKYDLSMLNNERESGTQLILRCKYQVPCPTIHPSILAITAIRLLMSLTLADPSPDALVMLNYHQVLGPANPHPVCQPLVMLLGPLLCL